MVSNLDRINEQLGPNRPVGDPRKLNGVSSRTTLDHPRVFSRVSLRGRVGNAVAVKKGLTIKSKKGLAELLIEWVIQKSAPLRTLYFLLFGSRSDQL